MLAEQPTQSSQTKSFLRWLEASSEFPHKEQKRKKGKASIKKCLKVRNRDA